jgi:hypothetical protein
MGGNTSSNMTDPIPSLLMYAYCNTKIRPDCLDSEKNNICHFEFMILASISITDVGMYPLTKFLQNHLAAGTAITDDGTYLSEFSTQIYIRFHIFS